MKTKNLFRISLLLVVLSIGGACGKVEAPQTNGTPPAEPGASGEKLVIGLMPKLIGIDYFNATKVGAYEAAEELGVTLEYDGPVTNDVTLQAQMVETWISKKYDAIAIAPNDPDAIAPVLEKARKRGIKIVSWDADAKQEARDFFVNQATAEALAKTLIDLVAKNVGEDAKFLYLTGSLTAANQNLWMAAMNKYIAEAHPGLTNLSETPKASEEDQALATQVTTDCLKAYTDMQALLALTSVALPGAAEGLRKSGAADRVYLTGFATPKVMNEYVKDGTVKQFVLWNPQDLGYLSVYAAVAAVKGTLKAGDTEFDAGRLGKVQVEGDMILLGEPLVFDKDNIDQFNF